MTPKRLIVAGLVLSLAATAPLSPAFAWRHRGGPLFWPFAAGAAVLGAAAAIATAPLRAVAPPPPPPYPAYGYPPAPYSYAPPPPPGYYGYPPQ